MPHRPEDQAATRAPAPRRRQAVLGVPIDALSPAQALDRVAAWAAAGDSRYVCFCNVHSVVTASRDAGFGAVVAGADLAAPDGAPVAWAMRRAGQAGQRRVSGPDFMLEYLGAAAARGEPVYLYGGSEQTLQRLVERLHERLPQLVIAGTCSPPFRALSADEESAIVERINASGARTVWVSLGCPKQEQWMARHRGRIGAVMLGVGAAFDFHAGTIQRAPAWMRHGGLEWLHRLLSEPRRLWKRYLVTNTLFLAGVARQAWRGDRSAAG